MFVLDDLVLAPLKGFLWLARELHGAVEREFADERDRTMRQLQSLHMRFDAGQIDEAAFDEQEARLLDRLDELDGLADAEADGEGGDHDENEADENESDESEDDAPEAAQHREVA